jgi:hypothetical protein
VGRLDVVDRCGVSSREVASAERFVKDMTLGIHSLVLKTIQDRD